MKNRISFYGRTSIMWVFYASLFKWHEGVSACRHTLVLMLCNLFIITSGERRSRDGADEQPQLYATFRSREELSTPR